MNIEDAPFTCIDWNTIANVESTGDSGTANSKTIQIGTIRLRLVEFSSNYQADHWCAKGHIVHILEGTLITLLEDGSVFQTAAGNSFLVGERTDLHRVQTTTGARALIID